MFVIGSALFTVGTLLAATAAGEWMLVTGRIVQGAGAACLSPAAMSLLLRQLPRRAAGTGDEPVGRGVGAGRSHRRRRGRTARRLVRLVVGVPGHRPRLLAAVVMAGRVLDDNPQRGSHRSTARSSDHHRRGRRPRPRGTRARGRRLAGTFGPRRGSRFPSCSRPYSSTSNVGPPTRWCRWSCSAPGSWRRRWARRARRSSPSLHVRARRALPAAGARMSPEAGGLAMVPTSLTGFVVSLVLLPRVLRTVRSASQPRRRPARPGRRPPVARLRARRGGYL